jgi:hypothetical protein
MKYYVDTDRIQDDWREFEDFGAAEKYYNSLDEGFNKILYNEKFETISEHLESKVHKCLGQLKCKLCKCTHFICKHCRKEAEK